MKVIIIGGGIGGLMTAISLLDRGIEVKVFEQATCLETIGAGIWMAPNALAILNKYNLADDVLKSGNYISKSTIEDINRNIITQIDFDKVKARYGFGNIAIHRGVLHQILLDRLPGNNVITGKRFDYFSQDAVSVKAFFSDGTAETGDVLIGADGLCSKVRQQIYPDVCLRDSSQICWRFVTEYNLPKGDRHWGYEIWGKEKGLRAGYSYIDHKRVYCYITTRLAGEVVAKSNLIGFLSQLCNQFPKTVLELIASAEDTNVFEDKLYDLPLNDAWSSHRVVLLGDAAHASTPNLGQGGSQAIEDAYAISKCLAEGSTLTGSLKAYEYLRRWKAKSITRLSWTLSRITNLDGWKKALVMKLIKLTPQSVTIRQLDKQFSVEYLEAYQTQ